MKAKFAYFLLIVGILALLGVGAVMTRSLFDMSVEGTEIARLEKPERPAPAAQRDFPVAERIIEVGSEKPAVVSPPSAAGESVPSPVRNQVRRAEPARPAAGPARVKPEPAPAAPARAPVPKVTRSAAPPPAGAPDAGEEAAGIGRVTGIRGAVYATDTSGARRILALESWIFSNDKIDTGQDARLAIKFQDGSTLSQGENTTIVVDKYVYDPKNCDKSCFAVRFIRGLCRVITGAIAELNPNRFEVRTRMATVGIRGCDLAFRATPERDDIYVIDLAGKKLVRVNTASDGRRLINVLTGHALEVDDAKRTVIDITEPNSVVFITHGKGATRGTVGLEDIRQISAETSLLTPARPELLQAPDGAVFIVQPEKSAPPQSADQAK